MAGGSQDGRTIINSVLGAYGLPQLKPTKGFRVYDDPEEPFTFLYPASWVRRKNNQRAGLAISDYGTADKLSLEIFPEPASSSASDLAAAAVQKLMFPASQVGGDARLEVPPASRIKAEQQEIDGKVYTYIAFTSETTTRSGYQVRRKNLAVAAVRKGSLYVLGCSARSDQFDKEKEAAFETVVQSFRLLPTMVRSFPFEVTLVQPCGEPLAEVEKNGQAYAVASPGQVFEVRFTVHPHPHSAEMLARGLFHSVSVQVDGVDVGYTKSFTCPSTSSFVGFLASGDVQACSYRSFVFSTPQSTENKQAETLQSVEGTVQVQVYNARCTGALQPARQWVGQGATNESVAAVPEGKKWFMQPSLTTGQGALQTERGFIPLAYQRVGGPIATLTLRYETPTTLQLRGVLRQEEPAHRAILQRFPETAAKEEQPAAATVAAGRTLKGDINYSYHLFGNETSSKPPLVMVMGMGATQYAWSLPVLEEMSKTRRVLIFDNALTGLSVDTKAAERSLPLTIPFMAASTVELIKALNLTGASKPDLLGYSLGGMIAQTIAGSHSDAVGAVISVASSYAGRTAPQPEGGINAMLKKLTSEEASDPFLMFPLGAADPAFCNYLNDVVSLQFAAVPNWQGLNTSGYALGTIIPAAAVEAVNVPLDIRAKQAAAVRQHFAGYGTLPRLAAPTNQIMFMGGSKDVIFPIATQSKAAAAVPESWLITVPNAGHGIVFQHPDLFARQVLTFLDSAQTINPDSYAAYYAPANAAVGSATGSLAIAAAAAAAALLALA
ncbi:hydrolase [Chlorella sorokiniana]|uniref:Hydrolase n=1 Tax=Chlorella sorokiniana TaxID=3076 RepID=A0A2P6TU01_CHLSO|nr:hydrolase [Chlorella sorokiniana]|eukprot:PRW57552.1 hydrolase [Chlorella sorokiniana]